MCRPLAGVLAAFGVPKVDSSISCREGHCPIVGSDSDLADLDVNLFRRAKSHLAHKLLVRPPAWALAPGRRFPELQFIARTCCQKLTVRRERQGQAIRRVECLYFLEAGAIPDPQSPPGAAEGDRGKERAVRRVRQP